MGVGAGNLGKKKKYVVLLEFYGPAPLVETRKLGKALAVLLRRYRGQKKEDVSADKRRGDPRRGWVKGFNPPDPEEAIRAAAKLPKRRGRSR
jgi:hypothetical protein